MMDRLLVRSSACFQTSFNVSSVSPSSMLMSDRPGVRRSIWPQGVASCVVAVGDVLLVPK